MSLKDTINTLNTTSFSSITNQLLWIVGSLAMTTLVVWLGVTGHAEFKELAYALLFAWTGKSGISALDAQGKRKTANSHVEAKGRADAMVAAAKNPTQPVDVHVKDEAVTPGSPARMHTSEPGN